MVAVVQASHRPLRGSRLSSFYPPIPAEGPSLSDLDSAFQLQEYISLLIRKNPHDVEAIVSLPGKVKGKGDNEDTSNDKDGKGEVQVDEACWIYEHLRRIAQDLSHPLITSLQQECTRSSCPEMKAGEWLYLCVAHGNDGAMEQCCAIDYIIHTLDSATALLNSPRAFPSRLSIPHASIRHFSSLARRLGRIFAHAYFHHREAFESAEAESSLYARFLALTARFELVPPDFLVIPPRIYSTDTPDSTDGNRDADPPRLMGASLHPSGGYEQSGAGDELDKDGLYARQNQEVPRQELGMNRSWSPEKPSGSPVGGGVLSSPRKVGRNRTDTMVLSDMTAFNEEMQRNAALHEPDPVDTKEEEDDEDVHEQIQSSFRPIGLPGDEREETPPPQPIHEDDIVPTSQSKEEKEEEAPSEKEPHPVPPPESSEPSELPHVDTLELVADSKEVCKPHTDPSACSLVEPPSEDTGSQEPPSELPATEVPIEDPKTDSDANDIELLLERKRVLDEAQVQSLAQAEEKEGGEEEEEENKGGEGFIVVGEQDKDDDSPDPSSPSSSEELVEPPEATEEAESNPADSEPESKVEVPLTDEPVESQPAPSVDEEDTAGEVDPNTTIEEDLHDVEKALQ